MRRPAGRGLAGILLFAAGSLMAIRAALINDGAQLALGLVVVGCGWIAWRATYLRW